jgi:hypothetical protein
LRRRLRKLGDVDPIEAFERRQAELKQTLEDAEAALALTYESLVYPKDFLIDTSQLGKDGQPTILVRASALQRIRPELERYQRLRRKIVPRLWSE